MKSVISIALLLFIFTSCKDENKGENATSDSSKTTILDKKNSKKISSCFEDYNYNLAKILTKEDVLKYFESSYHNEIETEESRRKSKDRYDKIVYSHKTNRTIKIAHLEAPDDNTIELSGLEFSKLDEEKTLEFFERKYKKLSEQEVQEMIANLERNYADTPKEELEQAKKFLEARKNLNYTPVQGLGTAAYWQEVKVSGNNFGAELVVLTGTVEFTVKAKIDNDNTLNAQTAIAIAKDILAKCN